MREAWSNHQVKGAWSKVVGAKRPAAPWVGRKDFDYHCPPGGGSVDHLGDTQRDSGHFTLTFNEF